MCDLCLSTSAFRFHDYMRYTVTIGYFYLQHPRLENRHSNKNFSLHVLFIEQLYSNIISIINKKLLSK